MSEGTAMITAATWMLKLPFTAMEEGADLTSVSANEIRAIQYNAELHTLERAAKAVCTWCRDGYAVTGDRCPRTHVYGTDGHVPCYAAEIWVLIPETAAPTAGNDKDADA